MIENENEFKLYMKRFGPYGINSQSNYVSWLKFISRNDIPINTNLPDNQSVIEILQLNEEQRNHYKHPDDYSNFKTALNTYRKFLSSTPIIVEDVRDIESENEISKTTKEQLIQARLGQGKFRKDLIEVWNKCAISKFDVIEILIASHILPWRNSTNEERLNPHNGLLLKPDYDKLFDKGWISFNDDGTIILSNKLTKNQFEQLGLNSESRLWKINKEIVPFIVRHREIFNEVLSGQ